jgi:hypothetical protein
MAVIFPKSSNFYVKVLGAVIGFGALVGVGAVTVATHPVVVDTGYQPEQPVPYSHKLHAGSMGMDCYYCHSTVYKASFAAVPSTETCMNCHVKVKEKSPRLEPVRESYRTGNPVPWVKVHKLPDYVYFAHQPHINAGVSCVSCHGRVDQMVEVKQVEPLNMGWCIDCHRNPAANLRPVELVTNLGWKPEGDPAEYGKKIIAEKHINPPVHCSGCHR